MRFNVSPLSHLAFISFAPQISISKTLTGIWKQIGGGEWSRVTMARRSPPQLHTSRRGVVSFRWKLITALSASLCVLALFSIYHRQSRPVPSLSAARSRIPLHKYSGDRPKIAFLFLARHDLPLDFLWDRFFKVRWLSIPLWIGESLIISCCDFWQGGDERNLSIYVHSTPGFVFDEGTTRSHFFHNRQLKNSIEVRFFFMHQIKTLNHSYFDGWTETSLAGGMGRSKHDCSREIVACFRLGRAF